MNCTVELVSIPTYEEVLAELTGFVIFLRRVRCGRHNAISSKYLCFSHYLEKNKHVCSAVNIKAII